MILYKHYFDWDCIRTDEFSVDDIGNSYIGKLWGKDITVAKTDINVLKSDGIHSELDIYDNSNSCVFVHFPINFHMYCLTPDREMFLKEFVKQKENHFSEIERILEREKKKLQYIQEELAEIKTK